MKKGASVFASLWLLFIVSFSVRAGEKPNVILIMADDMGYECIRANGGTDYRTPNLDRMAAEGIRFTHCYSDAMCTPSRVKIMTGKYNFRNYHYFAHLDYREYTIGNLMRDAGYSTFIGGKWQLNGYGDWRIPDSLKHKRIDMQGFDEFCMWQLALGVQNRYWDPVLEQNGKVIGTVRRSETVKNPEAFGESEVSGMKDKYGPDLVVARICDFITRKKDRPFFIYYPMILPHSPFMPTPDSKDLQETNSKKNYADMVAYVDKLVGRIRDQLEKEGVLDNTVIMFTGDNGTSTSITSTLNGEVYKGGKGSLPNNGTWAPLIVYWEKTAAKGIIVDDLIDFSDFFPTLGEAAGSLYPMALSDGFSFWPRLEGEAGNPREWIYVQHDPGLPQQFRNIGRFVRDRRYKLYEDGRFFDLQADLQELAAPLNPESLSGDAVRAHEKLREALSGFPAWNPITNPPMEE